MRFTKMHGAGNDFVVLDLRDGLPPPDAALAAALADRHRGVGCDQILTIEAPRSAAAVSVVENGLPVPAANTTTLPSSRYCKALGRT